VQILHIVTGADLFLIIKVKQLMKRICVNCGSNPGNNPAYLEMAEILGQILSNRNLELVYGGASVGLMGNVADAVIKSGGSTIGVIPKMFADKVSHQELTNLYIVDSMHERKAKMFELSDGFIALPGGFGTIEEITELLTWAQLGINKKPCGIINVDGYFDKLLTFFDRGVTDGFIKSEHREMLIVEDSPGTLLDRFEEYNAPDVKKWVRNY
jgi:uncharacterized protein (TIGR00730 family)